MDDTAVQLLKNWNDLKAKIDEIDVVRKPLADQELQLRKMIITTLFTGEVGKEGTNTVDLANDWKLKGTIKIDRKVDEAALTSLEPKLVELGLSADKLVRWKPEVAMKEYRGLTDEQRLVFDQALEIKPSTPTLELVPPKGP